VYDILLFHDSMPQKEGRSVPLWSRAGKFHHSVSLAHFWWRMSLFCEKLMLFERKEKRFPFPTQGLSPRVCQIHEVDGFGPQTWNIALNPGHWDKLF
jgi:hypothetical protein